MNTNPKSAAERGAQFAHHIVIPVIKFLCALGGQVVIYTGLVGRIHAASALAVGVSPASNLTTNLPQSLVTQFDKVFIENLKGETPWQRCCSRRSLDENAGNKLALYMYSNLAAPATPPVQSPEGTVQTGLTVAVVTNTSVIGQYADYANISSYALQTAIDPALEALGVQMAYRLAQVINNILQGTANGAATVDPTVNMTALLTGPNLTAVDITMAVASLAGINAQPFADGKYAGILHPYIVGDLLADTSPNGITDVLKRSAEGAEKLRELPSPDGDNVTVIDWGGVVFHQSTFVTQSAGPLYRTYIIGKDGVIGVSFGAKENTQVGDGSYRNIQVWVRRLTEPSGYDPSKMIGGFALVN